MFSSLSESGFIPTKRNNSFTGKVRSFCSHLFQRVASFLLSSTQIESLVSVRKFSSLSESGFIPTLRFLSRISRFFSKVLISFREWLHSYSTDSCA